MDQVMNTEAIMLEAGHQLVQCDRDGEVYCRRCGLYSPSAEEQPCISLGPHRAAGDKAA